MLLDSAIILILDSVPDFLTNILPLSLISFEANFIAFLHFIESTIDLSLTVIFSKICGVDLIIDDTPEVVVVSSFNVVRREIARLTLKKLISDGRIHPAKVEEFHEKSRNEMDKQLLSLGEKAQMEIGVHGILQLIILAEIIPLHIG